MASIQERNGHYKITVSCGYDIYGKKLVQTTTFTPDPSLSPKKKQRSVEDFARAFEDKIRNGASMEGRKITLKEFSERWMEDYGKINLQPGTVVKYTQELNDKILPALGHLKLSEIKPHTIAKFFASMTRNGVRKDGKSGGYSRGSISKTKNVLSSMLHSAVEWEIIDSNPCDKVRLPSIDPSDSVRFFTPEQTAAFLAYIEEPYTLQIKGHRRVDDTGIPYTVGDYTITKSVQEQLKILFNLAIYTGLRKGELLALRWDDVDFEREQIKVCRSVTIINGEPVCKAPKTKTSNRTVSIPHALAERLKRYKAEQAKYIAYVGDYWQGDNWIFTQENGKIMGYSTPYQAFQDAIARHNRDHPEAEPLPQIPLHGLRHTSATLLIASHQDVKTVSKRLGHAQTSTTLNVYAHALQESDRKAADALADLLEEQLNNRKNKP